MASSDEPRDEGAQGDTSYDEALFVPGPRRSTYRPPVGFPPPPPARRPPEPVQQEPVQQEPVQQEPVQEEPEAAEEVVAEPAEPEAVESVSPTVEPEPEPESEPEPEPEPEPESEPESEFQPAPEITEPAPPATAAFDSPAAFMPKLTYTPPAEPAAPTAAPIDLASIFAPPPFTPPVVEPEIQDDPAPAANEPSVDYNAEEPEQVALVEDAPDEPIVVEPAVDEPVFEEPTVVEPADQEPVFAEPIFIEAGPAEPEPAYVAPDETAAVPTEQPEFEQSDNSSDYDELDESTSIPHRESLTDSELTEELERTVSKPGATLDAIDELERQLKLRDEEARRYQEWEQSMLATGTPEAIATVEEVRPQFEGVVFPTQSIPIQYPTTEEAEPEAESEPEPEAAPEPDPAPEPEPTPETPVSPFAPPTSLFAPPVLIEPPAAPPATTTTPEPESWLVEETIQPSATTTDFEFEAPSEDYSNVDPFGDLPTAVADDAPGEFTSLLFVEPTGPVETTDVEEEPDSAAPSIQELLYGTAPAEVPEETTAPEPQPEPVPVPEPVLVATAPVAPRIFETEDLAAQPTPIDRRVGKAVRLFWLWFAANSSIISVAFGAMLFTLGMSLRQAIIATLAGVVLSFIPLGLGTLAGKRSGQPTMIVSRATFGIRGNVVPAIVALVSRIFWGAALMWLLATSVASALIGAGFNGTASYAQLTIVSLGATFVIALVIAFFGYQLLARFQLVVSLLSAILVIGLIAMTWQYVDISRAMTAPDGSLALVVSGAVLVFSFVGLVWANSSGDLARYQSPQGSSGRSMLSATFGTAIPTFVLIAYGALLAASDPAIATGLVDDPLNALGRLLPSWYPIPLIAAAALSLLSGVVISIYSGSFAVAAIGIRMKQTVSTLLVAVLVFAVGWLIASIGGDLTELFRDFATTLAVPVAAWAGLFAAEIMIRNRSYDSASLLKVGGVYPSVRWMNLSAFVVITAIGWAFTMSTIDWLSWQGYLAKAIDNPIVTDLSTADIGVILALVLGLIVPLATGVKAIRKQEVVEAAPN